MNIYRHKRENIKLEPLQTTAHHFEVRKKDVYELLRGEKYTKVKTEVKSEPTTETEAPASKEGQSGMYLQVSKAHCNHIIAASLCHRQS